MRREGVNFQQANLSHLTSLCKINVPRSFPKNVWLVAVDSVHYTVVGDFAMKMVSWCPFCRSESHGLVTLNAAAGGGPPGPVLKERGTGRGWPHPPAAALKVTRP